MLIVNLNNNQLFKEKKAKLKRYTVQSLFDVSAQSNF